jgi:hypothetical protein
VTDFIKELVDMQLDKRNEISEADKLLTEALFMRMYGERPPGAPEAPEAETWTDWDIRCEAYLRSRVGGTK